MRNINEKASRRNKMTNEQIIEKFKYEYFRVNPANYEDFYSKSIDAPNLYILETRLGMKWNDMLVFIGVPREKINVKKDISKDELINSIQEFYYNNGRVPTMKEYSEKYYCIDTVKKLMGSYNCLVKEAGLKIENKTPIKVKESNEELLKMYIDFSNRIGRPANIDDLDSSSDIYNSSVFMIRFGGMKNLKLKAGFKPYHNNNRYTKAKTIKLLIKEYMNYERRLTVEEIEMSEVLPNHVTILMHFQTTKMEDVWEEIEGIIKK